MAANASKKAKVLRIGLFQNNRIIEERLFRTPSPVTIGSDFKKNTFVVPASALPKTQTVFDFKGGKYVLNVTKQMTGRVKNGDQISTIQDLIQSGGAQQGPNGTYVIALSQASQGRVTVGDATLLFQFVTPPPPRPKPVLPAAMRGGWIQGLDRILVGSTSLVAILFIGFVVFLESRDWPVPLERQQVLRDEFVQLMLNKEPEPEPEPEVQKADGEGEEVAKEEKEEEKKEEKTQEAPPKVAEEPAAQDKPKSADELARLEAERKRRLAEEVQNSTIIGQLGAVTEDGEGGIVNMLANGAGATTMDEAFAGSVGIKTDVAGAEKTGLRSSGSSGAEGTGTAVGGVAVGKGSGVDKALGGVAGPDKSDEKAVRSKLDIGGATASVGGSLDSDAISNAIKRKQSQFQKCHERELKKNPKAGGKITIVFVIGSAGRVTSAKAAADSVGGSVAGCVANVIERIPFPRPKGGDATVRKAFVFSPAS